MLKIIKAWLEIACIMMLVPLVITSIIYTDGVLPIDTLSNDAIGRVISRDDDNQWCNIRFNVNDFYVETRVRADADIGVEIPIKYCAGLLGYRATAKTIEDIKYWLYVWYVSEASILVPAFLTIIIAYVLQGRW